jgi:hypothetical protein
VGVTYDSFDGVNEDMQATREIAPDHYYVYEFCYLGSDNSILAQDFQVIYTADLAPPTPGLSGNIDPTNYRCSGGEIPVYPIDFSGPPDPSLQSITLKFFTDQKDSNIKFLPSPAGGQTSPGAAASHLTSRNDLGGLLNSIRNFGAGTYSLSLEADKSINSDSMTYAGVKHDGGGVRVAIEIGFQDNSYDLDDLKNFFDDYNTGITRSVDLDEVLNDADLREFNIPFSQAKKNRPRFMILSVGTNRCEP